MSKSKGNGIDPVDIIDTYGTDAMRFVLCDMQTGTQDIRLPVTAICPVCNHHNDLANTPHGKSIFTYICGSCKSEFDVLGTMPELPSAKLISERFEEGRAFCTKLWNSARFAFMNLEDVPAGDLNYEQLSLEDRWILDELNRTVQAVTTGLADYNPSAALNAAKEFFWGALCDWYLELIKSRVQNTDASSASIARWILAFCLDTVLRLFHPFVPFITEHLWQQLNCQVPHRNLGNIAQALPSEYLIQAAWPEPNIALANEKARSEFILMQNITRAIREIRSAQNIPPKQLIDVTFKLPSEEIPDFKKHLYIAVRLCGISNCIIDPAAKRKPGDASKIVENIQLFIHNIIDDEAERLRLTKAINKVEKEIATCSKQLANPKFIERAPAEVIEEQKRRLQSYQDQLNNYQSALKALE